MCTLVIPGFYSTATGLVSLGLDMYTKNLTTNGSILSSVKFEMSKIICKNTNDFSICEAVTDAIFLKCNAGYYCSGGSSTATPLARSGHDYGDICPRGHYCPVATNASQECEAGTYQPSIGKDACLTVPKGYYATLPRSMIFECPKGSICPIGNKSSPVACPAGTFGNLTRLWDDKSCFDCPPGMYCSSPGIDEPTGLCDPGYICTGKNIVSAPESVCPAGHFW